MYKRLQINLVTDFKLVQFLQITDEILKIPDFVFSAFAIFPFPIPMSIKLNRLAVMPPE